MPSACFLLRVSDNFLFDSSDITRPFDDALIFARRKASRSGSFNRSLIWRLNDSLFGLPVKAAEILAFAASGIVKPLTASLMRFFVSSVRGTPRSCDAYASRIRAISRDDGANFVDDAVRLSAKIIRLLLSPVVMRTSNLCATKCSRAVSRTKFDFAFEPPSDFGMTWCDSLYPSGTLIRRFSTRA